MSPATLGDVAMSTSVMFRRALLRHCPVCGSGHLFRHWTSMAVSCPRCGLRFRRVDGQWLGSWFLNILAVQTAVSLVLIVAVGLTYPDPDMAVTGIAGALSALTLPVVFFPFSRTLWMAIDLMMRPLELGEDVAPGFELDVLSPPHRGLRR